MPKNLAENVTILQVLDFHRSDITSCDIDNKYRVASGSSDKKVAVYEWKSSFGYEEAAFSPLTEYKYGVSHVQILPEEGELIASSFDGSISIFNIENGELLHTLVHVNLVSVRTFCYVSETKHLISAGDDGSLCIWDLYRKTLVQSVLVHHETITTACCSPDCKILLTGDTTGFVKLWHIELLCNNTSSTNPACSISDCHDMGINGADFSPITDITEKGKSYELATCGNDNLLRIWNVLLSKMESKIVCDVVLKFSLSGHASAVTAIKFNFLGNIIASTSLDKTIRLWSSSGRSMYQCSKVLNGHKRYVTTCAFSPDGTLLATGSNDKTVIVWDLTGERNVETFSQKQSGPSSNLSSPLKLKNISKVFQRLENLGNSVNSCCFSKNNLLAAGGTDRLTRLWYQSINFGKFDEIAVSPLSSHEYAINQVDFSSCGTMLVTCSLDGTAVVWDITEYNQKGKVHATEGGIKTCKFSPDSQLLATAGDNEIVSIWDASTLHLKANMSGHTDSVTCLSFTYDSKYLASGCAGGNLRLWGVTPCTTICLLLEESIHDLGCSSMDFCMANDTDFEKYNYLLATGGNDCAVKVWRIQIVDELTAKAHILHQLVGHGGDVTCVRFPTHTSDVLVSTAIDKTARIWDTKSGKCLQVLDSKVSMLTCCSFSADGCFLATGTLDKSIIIWDLRRSFDEFDTFALKRLIINKSSGRASEIRKEKINKLLHDLNKQVDIASSDVPHEFVCPITQQIIVEPVICEDGHTYEKSAIMSWFSSGKVTSPLTNEQLLTPTLMPNDELKARINDFVANHHLKH